ncbi:hypothetical protein BZZ01_24870 [Nostocales cyanobacterium HT-58-2]|nr:hypothetical protein BZZ01_24870 [Nostocales cyanobacterium HT-58-2]
MNSIIRLNAFKTSSQTNKSGINLHNLYPYCDLVCETAFIYGNVASIKGALPEASTDTHTTIAKTPQIASKNTGYWSTSIKTLLEQRPLMLAHLVTLRSIAFFIAVVVWGWTGKIEQVNHVRGKFVALDEPQKLQLQHSGKLLNTAMKETQELKMGQVVAELDRELLVSEIEVQGQDSVADQMQLNQIKDLMARTRLLAQNCALVRAEENQATVGVSPQFELQDTETLPVQPTQRLEQSQIQQLQTQKLQINLDASPKQFFSTSSKIVMLATSIFPTA